MAIIYLCLGSNIGDRIGCIQQANLLLCADEKIRVIRSSTMYETEPWGNKEQEWFINAVIEAKTNLPPDELLGFCRQVEEQIGRNRAGEIPWGARIIDIDILFYDEQIINTQDLTIPHKHLHNRAFALVPLLELIPDFIHPVYGKTMIELHEELENPEDVFLYGTRIHG